MFLFRQPDAPMIERWQAEQASSAFSYPEVGMTRAEPPPGYFVNHYRLRLGYGGQVYDAACEAIRRWRMFPPEMVEISNPDTPLEPGRTVTGIAHFGPVRWVNFCRIVYRVEETGPVRGFGFAYGTLHDHALRGEERFQIEQRHDGSVWYDLLAYARPRHWLSYVGYPLARVVQKRFARLSLRAMAKAMREILSRSFNQVNCS
jgi:uncharacterized protein (UPF0548 family)